MEDRKYLDEGFDPASLKVAELRVILHEHGISCPEGAKKADLVGLFRESVIHSNAAETSVDEEVKPEKKKVKLKKKKPVSGEENDSIVTENDDSVVEEEVKKKKSKKKSSESSSSSSKGITKDTKKSKSKKQEKLQENIALAVPKTSPKSKGKTPDTSIEDVSTSSTPKSAKSSAKKPRKRPLTSSAESPSVKKVKKQAKEVHKSIFDDSDDDVEVEVLTPKKRALELKLSPKVIKSPKVETPVKTPKTIKTKKDVTPRTTKSPRLSSEKKSTSSKSNHFIDNLLKEEDDFENIEDETKDFDSNLRRIKGEPEPIQTEPESDNALIRSPLKRLDTAQLASLLGVTTMLGYYAAPEIPPANIDIEQQEPALEEAEIDIKPSIPESEADYEFKEVKSSIPKVAIIRHEIESELPETIETLDGKAEKVDSVDGSEENDDDNVDITEEANLSVDVFDKVEAEMIEEIKELEPTNIKSVGSFSIIQSLFFLFLWVAVMSSALFGYWYREQMLLVGYCGFEIDQRTVADDSHPWLVAIGDYVDSHYKPACIPCPAHARCFNHLELGCHEDFIEFKPWYDFLIPTERKCIPDTKKAEKLELMIDMTLDLLRSKNADKSCGMTSMDNFEAGISVGELHDILLSIKAPYITVEEFEDLWNRSLIELEKEPEIISGYPIGEIPTTEETRVVDEGEENNDQKILRSTSLQNISLTCQLQNTLIMAILENKHVIMLVLVVFLAYKVTQWQYYKSKRQQLQLEIIYKEVMNKLQKQKRMSELNKGVPGYIGSIQLRDLILSEEANLSRKLKLWKHVSKKVEMNTNVKSTLMETHGEIMLVWEWITTV